MTELISVPRAGKFSDDGIGVHIDTRLPGTTLGRKVYQTPPGRTYIGSRAHRHDASHDLVCLSGGCVVGLRKGDEEVELIRLGPGESCHVPPGITHQLEVLPDSVVASYFSPTTWLRKDGNLEILDEDWFRDPLSRAAR